MAKNLNYAASGKCGNANSTTLSDNNTNICDTYGRLYNWNTAKTVCPAGWHLPSQGEWNILLNYAGSSTAATKLKTKNGWNGTDDYNFSALPGSYGSSDWFSNNEVGSVGLWWSSTPQINNNVYVLRMETAVNNASWNEQRETNVYSVRCVRN